MQSLREFAEANYDLIATVVIGMGDLGLVVAKAVIELGTPVLQGFFA
ncbi:hypothetical protein [Nocardia lasii]|uniref:Uncharacterized protein n=1 Tax=Nocardia lasii TaxID=1616107 RepID=A0ABW1JZJ9_9NOCA